jgi:hypothetical protein
MDNSKIVIASIIGSCTTVISSRSIECSLLLISTVALTMSNKVNSVSFNQLHEGLVQLL